MQPSLATHSVSSRVLAWLQYSELPNAQIARSAGVDEKTIRNAKRGEWNPTVETLAKLEAVMPADWQPPKKKRAA
jgi:transcriptional regulator with XRE-family HTH domain